MTKQEKRNQKRYLCYSCKKFKSNFIAEMQYHEDFSKKYFKNKKKINQCIDCLRIQLKKNPDYNLKVIKHIEIL